MSKSKLFGNLANARLKPAGEQAQERTGEQAQSSRGEQAPISEDVLRAITPDQSEPYSTMGCKVPREAAHFFAIRAKQTRQPVADVIRRALIAAYGVPPADGQD